MPLVIGAGQRAEPARRCAGVAELVGAPRRSRRRPPCPRLRAQARERTRADGAHREHHVGVAQAAELGALPRNTPGCREVRVTTWVEPGIRSCLKSSSGIQKEWITSSELRLKRTASPVGTTSGWRPTVPLRGVIP